MEKLTNLFKNYLFFQNNAKQQLSSAIYAITGTRPSNLALYEIALQHSSIEEGPASNERLEFLGDAVLSLIVGEYLFKKYPLQEEGFLTDIRSRIVNRASLEELAKKVHLNKLLRYDANTIKRNNSKSIYGNALEALIGAVYIDKGYTRCQKFVVNRLLHIHIDLKDRIENDTNFKSQIVNWANKQGKNVTFQIVNETREDHIREFTAEVLIDGEVIGTGTGRTKKSAEQAASQHALQAASTTGKASKA